MKRLTTGKEILEQPDGTVFNVYIRDMDINIIGEASAYTIDDIKSTANIYDSGNPYVIFMGDLEKNILCHYPVMPSIDVVYVLDVIE